MDITMEATRLQDVSSRSRNKRVFDVIGAAAGLVVFAPVIVVIAGAILLDDGGPILFRQARIGKDRHLFDILKFRSMRDGAVTRVGRRLRATGLDELPQFLNILNGEMSAVGPRPLTEYDVRRLGWDAPRYDFRWRVRPGLTGLAQVNATTSTNRVSMMLDRRYIAEQCVSLDLALVAASFAVNVFGKARVRRFLRGR